MLVKIAWKNIWRSKTRSLVVIMAVGLGLWAGIFTTSFMYGISNQRLRGIINSQISHIQIHQPKFTDDMDPKLLIPNGQMVLNDMKQNPEVEAAAGRVISPGMIASPTNGAGVFIKGIDPEDEAKVTDINTKLVEGDFFSEDRKNAILIGKKLAQKLNVKLRGKVVLSMQDVEGNITTGAFRVFGIFKTNSTKYDESNVFVRRKDLSRLLGCDAQLHEIALMLNSEDSVSAVKNRLEKKYPHLEIESWKDIAPELNYVNQIMDEYLQIFMVIILLAMAFGIVNTMLMAILERIREIGMLMAIGMNKFKIFTMIMMETIFLTFTGAPVGILLGILSINYLGTTGVDLAIFSEGLSSFDLDTVVYPALEYSFYPRLILLVIITAVLSSLYPAYKALSYHPASAIRAI